MATDAETGTDIQLAEPADPPELSVVVPAYNEAGNLTPLVEETAAALDGWSWECILVDDGSTDDTASKIEHLAELWPQVRGVFLSRNHGQSPALQAGIDHARGDVIVTMDGDGQNDPADIPDLVAALETGADCVSGHRSSRRDPWGKRAASRVQTSLAKATGPDINDFGCTLTAYRAEALDDVCLRGEMHRYIPALLWERGYRIEEREVNHRPRTTGETKYGAGRLLRGGVDLVWHVVRNRWGHRPMHLLGGLGAMAFVVGGLLGGWSLVERFLLGQPLAPHLPRLILVALLVGFGVQLLVFGITLELLAELRTDGDDVYRVAEVID